MPIDGLKTVAVDENNDWAYEFRDIPTPAPEPEVVPEPEAVTPEPEPTPVPEPTPDPVVETVVPEYKSKKYVPIEDEEKLAELLDKKYGYKKMKPEEKALAFIKNQNPELDDNEILFIAANDYGIGVDRVDETDLTSEQALELKKQDIARKKLLSQADNYFAEQASQVQLTAEDPLELDPAYKTYREQAAANEQLRAQQEQRKQEVLTEITSASKKVSDLKIPVEIDIDDSKLAIDVNFKLDENKQKELVSYAERYIPSDAEVAQFTDTSTGKFDFGGYLAEQANKLFAKDIIKAGIRQALAHDRQQFIEKELKNSTLRNNDVSQTADRKVDPVDYYFDHYAGR
jgi:hypothetical protein